MRPVSRPGAARSAPAVRAVRAACLLAWIVLFAVACDDSPTGDEFGRGPSSNRVLLDTEGTLEAAETALDTYRVAIPQNNVLGVIFESSNSIAAQWGPRGWREVIVSPGGTFGAVVTDVEGRDVFLQLRHGNWSEIAELPYRLRVIAVPLTPEHADEEMTIGSTTSEWIDPPLDVDVFSFHLEADDRFYIESESEQEPVTLRVRTPAGARYIGIVATGPELLSSPVFEADVAGDYQITVSSAGLIPDVATSYRIRVRRAPPEAIAQH